MWRIGRTLLLSAICALGPALASPARSWAADGLVDVGARGAPLHLWVEDRGHGDPILLLHGFGANSYTWRHIAPALAPTHRVISVDLKGAGRSDKPFDDAYGILDQVALLARLIDRKRLSGVTLIGQSMGGGIALALALELNQTHPGVLGRLILIDSIAYRQKMPLFIELLQTPVLAEVGAYTGLPELQVYKGLYATFYDPSRISFGAVRAYARPLYELGGRNALLSTAAQIVPRNLDALVARYHTIQQPTLLIWGAEDTIVPLWVGRKLARDLPRAHLSILRACGHAPQEEAPARTLNLIQAFLQQGH
jgi:pimeloyl-ACP methyl ester carboxylesterase